MLSKMRLGNAAVAWMIARIWRTVSIREFPVVMAAAFLASCSPNASDEIAVKIPEADRLSHTIGMIRTATPSEPHVVRILFYGQSITSPKWTEAAITQLRSAYPNVRFVATNLAIGGFASTLLERTVERDLAETYPDLVVFHVYGDHHAYERIIKIIRSRTSAEIIVQNDHLTAPVEPMCDEGLHLTLTAPPGCKGKFWYKQSNWEEHMSGKIIPDLANRYGLVVEDRRRLWDAYLKSQKIPIAALLKDGLHPNDAGWHLMANLFVGNFERLVQNYRGKNNGTVTSFTPGKQSIQKYKIEGNRIEIIADKPLSANFSARIDGQPIQKIDGCWQISRTTHLPGVPDWPALRQVEVASNPRAESWTATVTKLSRKQDEFQFSLMSNITGADGVGIATRDFISPSGAIRISAKDWVIPEGVSMHNKTVPEGFQVSWSRHFVCGHQSPVALTPSRSEFRYLVATGLSNGPHEVDLSFNPGDLPGVREIRAYHPPLKN